MDKPSVTYSIQTHDRTDTVCKQLDINQEKLHEGQKKLQKSASHSKQLPQRPKQQEEESALLTEEKHLIHMKDDLWRSLSIVCESKQNLKWCSFPPYQRKINSEQKKCFTYGLHHTTNGTQIEKLSPMINSPSYIPDRICKRRIQRQLKSNTSRLNFIRQIRQLPRQIISPNSFEYQFFNGSSFH